MAAHRRQMAMQAHTTKHPALSDLVAAMFSSWLLKRKSPAIGVSIRCRLVQTTRRNGLLLASSLHSKCSVSVSVR
jgi:hypothetical protein